ncbi:MAG TPA: hypothetical protein VGE19_07380 [Pseudoxanthomonas sp.]
MTEIDVPDWVVVKFIDELGKAAGYPPYVNATIQRHFKDALTAALGAWVVPQHQCMSSDEDDIPNGLRDIWMDVSADDYQKLTTRKDVRGRTLYTLRQEKPE